MNEAKIQGKGSSSGICPTESLEVYCEKFTPYSSKIFLVDVSSLTNQNFVHIPNPECSDVLYNSSQENEDIDLVLQNENCVNDTQNVQQELNAPEHNVWAGNSSYSIIGPYLKTAHGGRHTRITEFSCVPTVRGHHVDARRSTASLRSVAILAMYMDYD